MVYVLALIAFILFLAFLCILHGVDPPDDVTKLLLGDD
jgi:hypothetical protein